MAFVVDASVILAWLLPEERNADAQVVELLEAWARLPIALAPLDAALRRAAQAESVAVLP